MKLLNRLNVTRERGGPRKFSFEMSMSGVISVGIVAILGMCWVFILGILVGRGYRPEAAVPQIAQMMPTTETAQSTDKAPAAAPTVLKPEELQFMDGLQDKDGNVVADSTQKTPADGKKSPLDSRTTPMGAAPVATAIPAAPTPPPAARPRTEPAPKPKAKVEPAETVDKKDSQKFVATYQVASFPTKDRAEVMAKELSQKGLPASVYEATSGKRTLYRVKIRLKGTESEIASGLKRTGEKGPILLGKKPL